MTSVPIGIRVLSKYGCRAPCDRNVLYRAFILFFTFLCYTSYHLSRRPSSVVRSVLHQNCSILVRPPSLVNASNTWCDWKPFDGDNYQELFGILDYAYLFSYALAMFLSGHIAERVNLRHYLCVGMLLSGLLTIMFGMGHYWQIHTLGYYVAVQVVGGIFQASGWPSVVAVVGNWFGKGRRGFIMGVWNSHTSVGNILGSVISGIWVDDDWGLSFIVPGLIICGMAVLVFLFLVPYPEDVNCDVPDYVKEVETDPLFEPPASDSLSNGFPDSTEDDEIDTENSVVIESRSLLEGDAVTTQPHHADTPVSIRQALRIPGVVEFSLCLFFAKLVSYTFLFWLPKYISYGAHYDAMYSADLAALFDVGGIVGGILAGLISDYSGARASTCLVMLALAAPMLYVYQVFGNHGLSLNIVLLMICGALVNGPYALITTAVSADLGTHPSLHGNAKALATVTAIIDGTGSIGAAVGPLLTGLIAPYGWDNVFYMLIGADIAALLLLSRLFCKEVQSCGTSEPAYRQFTDQPSDDIDGDRLRTM